MSEILAEVRRNGNVESLHYGSIVVCDKDGTVLYYNGDPEMMTYARSSAKAFQFLPVFESGATKRFGHSLKQMAIMLGSHNGSAEHQQVTKSNLELIGLDESYLKCGSHLPVELRLKGELPVTGVKYTSLAHNCSGKHSGQLALSVHIGDDPNHYIDPESKTQKLVKQTVSEAYDYPVDQFKMGTDGCSLPNFCLPLRNMAEGYARIITKTTDSPIRREAYQTIYEAMSQHPVMVSGHGRHDLAITEACKGDVILKVGGEAVETIGVLSKGLGIAIKIADGNTRGLFPVICEVLRQLEVIDEATNKSLAVFSRPQLYNDRKINIGEIVPVFKLNRG
jgi:L-asparaginase II